MKFIRQRMSTAMARSAVFAAVAAFGVAAMTALFSVRAHAQEPPMKKPTIVLVHGAFAESSSWNNAARGLLAKGYAVVAVANPLRGVKSDANYLSSVLASIDGPVILVGHSYGGNVISNIPVKNSNVKALIFVAGFAPDSGETAAALASKFPGGTLGPTLAPPVMLPDGGKDLYIRQDAYRAQFAADVSAAEAKLMAATQRPITDAALNEPAGEPSWKAIPSWFLYGSLDKNIPAAAIAFMAQRAGAKRVVEVKGGSHVVMVSHPDALVKLVVEADAATKSAH